jgi:AcrR family transcriptional regulator
VPPKALQPDIRHRLLLAAGEVFAEFGYQNATVRDICARAGANIAAVNYHFGGKDELYAAVLEQQFSDTVMRFPLDLPAGSGPADALRMFVRVTVQRMLTDASTAWQNQLIFREITDPTAHLDTIANRFMRPHFAVLRQLIGALLGPHVPEHRHRMLALSVMGQIVFYKIGRHAVARVAPEQGTGPEEREQIAEHVAEVTLAAASDLRTRYEQTAKKEAL